MHSHCHLGSPFYMYEGIKYFYIPFGNVLKYIIFVFICEKNFLYPPQCFCIKSFFLSSRSMFWLSWYVLLFRLLFLLLLYYCYVVFNWLFFFCNPHKSLSYLYFLISSTSNLPFPPTLHSKSHCSLALICCRKLFAPSCAAWWSILIPLFAVALSNTLVFLFTSLFLPVKPSSFFFPAASDN